MTLFDHLRDALVGAGLVRRPDVAGELPPVWRFPDEGAVGPGDRREQGAPASQHDDGLVVSLMAAPGIPPETGMEDHRIDGVDIVMRGVAVAPIVALEAAIRPLLLGDPPNPGGRVDYDLAGLYVVQSRQWRPFQPISTGAGIYTFSVGYIFELIA